LFLEQWIIYTFKSIQNIYYVFGDLVFNELPST